MEPVATIHYCGDTYHPTGGEKIDMVARRLRSAQVVLSAAFLGLASGGVAACDSQPDEDEVFYCVDENENIVDEDNCDDTRARSGGVGFLPLFFLAHSSRYPKGLRPGTKVPAGGAKFAYNDAAARSQWGLPSTGRVANGTVKTGSVGKGGSGSRSGGG
jgi:hypothetical protein